MTALGNLVDSGEVLVAELDGLKVGLDTLGVGGLGEHAVAAAETPGNEDLGQGVAALLGDLVEGLVLGDTLAGGGDLVLGAQRRVGLGQDVLGEAVVDQLVVRQEGVDLNLVDHGHDLGVLGHGLELRDGPVGHTNSTGLAVGVQLLHGAPCLLMVLREVFEDHVLYTGLIGARVIGGGGGGAEELIYLSIGADLGLLLGLLLGGNGPVNEEEVDVVEPHPLEGVLKGPEDVIVTVQVVPDLGGHENVLTLDGGVGGEEIMDCITHLVLVEVEPGAIQVTVASVESSSDGGVGLALGALASEGTETDGGELDSVAQCASLSSRHNDMIVCR